ncbi:MAG: DUF948 domain-containing protein [Armatimonadetes bacterium]|nr:DUF948 domain-containing protein [Armatimonadota bacterium]NOG92186.1 DUF948 domain-containing protein [Armatimonadota bacterium]
MDAILILSIVQAVLLVALLLLVAALMARIRESGRRMDELVDNLNTLVTRDVRPALGEAREAVKTINSLADKASNTMEAAAPLVSAVGRVSEVLKKPSTPLWLDALKLGVGAYNLLRSNSARDEEAQAELPPSRDKNEGENE